MIAVELASVMAQDGHDIHVVSEGKSVPLWTESGISYTQHPGDSPEREVHEINPDLLVVCEGSPANMETKFAKEANRNEIPLVIMEDTWNGFTRISAIPDSVLTIDEHAARLVCEAYPTATVETVGNRAVRDVDIPQPLLETQEALRAQYGKIVVFAGQGSTDDLALCIACMERTKGCLIPRFHPKRVSEIHHPSGKPKQEVWEKMLEAVGEKVVRMDQHTTEQAIAISDVVCSGFSTALLTATHEGKAVVSLWTPEVQASLWEQSQLMEVPLVSLGAAHKVKHPVDLGALAPPEGTLSVRPYDPYQAYEIIKETIL